MHFFFGTPRRTLFTMLGLLVIAGAIRPDYVNYVVRETLWRLTYAVLSLLNTALTAIQPLIGIGLFIAVVYFFVKYALGGKGRKH